MRKVTAFSGIAGVGRSALRYAPAMLCAQDVVRSNAARWCRTTAWWLVLSSCLGCGDHVIVGREVLTSKARDAAVPPAADAGPSKVQAAHAERARAQADDKSDSHGDSKPREDNKDNGH
jgi:hypothetical protein